MKKKNAFALAGFYSGSVIAPPDVIPHGWLKNNNEKFILQMSQWMPVDFLHPNFLGGFSVAELTAAIDAICRQSARIDRHVARLNKYVDAVTNRLVEITGDSRELADKIRRAKDLIQRYDEIDSLLDEGAGALTTQFQSARDYDSKVLLVELGKRLRKTRQEKNLSRADVAKKLGVSVTILGYYERGDREISIPRLVTLAKFLDVSTDWLLGLRFEKKFFLSNSNLKQG